MKKPAVSVVIPCYNEGIYLPRCLESLQKQTFIDFEIIVVDNNSTDSTAQIAKQYNVRVVTEQKQGAVYARERGFQGAKAPIIATTDADTILPPNWLEIIHRIFQQEPSLAGISGGLSFIDGNKIQRWLANTASMHVYYPLAKFLLGHPPFTGTNCALRKSAWKKISHDLHVHNRKIFDDIDLSCHLSQEGIIYYAPKLKTLNSLRRWKRRPLHTSVEYTARLLRTVWLHKPLFKEAPLP